MDTNFKALIANSIWILVDFPLDHEPISCKWVFGAKLKSDCMLEIYKACLIARGFLQVED